MRCVWVLVIGCLVAATALRPLQVELRDPHAAQIDAPPSSVAVVARRQAAHLPELRLSLFVVEVAAAFEPPKMIIVAVERSPEAPDLPCAVETPCARGPPIA